MKSGIFLEHYLTKALTKVLLVGHRILNVIFVISLRKNGEEKDVSKEASTIGIKIDVGLEVFSLHLTMSDEEEYIQFSYISLKTMDLK